MHQRHARIAIIAAAVTLAALLAACGAPANPPQSPTNDTQPPVTTSDGKTIGADQVPPAQKLEQGPLLDSRDGAQPAAAPARE